MTVRGNRRRSRRRRTRRASPRPIARSRTSSRPRSVGLARTVVASRGRSVARRRRFLGANEAGGGGGMGRGPRWVTHRAVEAGDALVRLRLIGDGDEPEPAAAAGVHVGHDGHVARVVLGEDVPERGVVDAPAQVPHVQLHRSLRGGGFRAVLVRGERGEVKRAGARDARGRGDGGGGLDAEPEARGDAEARESRDGARGSGDRRLTGLASNRRGGNGGADEGASGGEGKSDHFPGHITARRRRLRGRDGGGPGRARRVVRSPDAIRVALRRRERNASRDVEARNR